MYGLIDVPIKRTETQQPHNHATTTQSRNNHTITQHNHATTTRSRNNHTITQQPHKHATTSPHNHPNKRSAHNVFFFYVLVILINASNFFCPVLCTPMGRITEVAFRLYVCATLSNLGRLPNRTLE